MAKKVRVGTIGAGGIARWAHIPAYQGIEGVEVVAVCDIDLKVARQTAEQFGIRKVFTDYREMLQMEEIDAVSVCSPNALHMQHSVDALEAGKHVLCEKPMAVNARQGQKMVEAAQRTEKKLMIALNNRFSPKWRALKGLIEEGRLGEIYFAKAYWTRRRGIPGPAWFTQKDLSGGGPLVDIGVHALDVTLWLMGLPKPVSVVGATYTKIGNRKPPARLGGWDPKKYGVEDLGVGLIRFENGATVFLEASFACNIGRERFNAELYGDLGGAELEPLRIYTEYGGMLADITPVGLPEVGGHGLEVAAFIEAIRKDKPSPVPPEEALVTTQILDAIFESAEKGKQVAIK